MSDERAIEDLSLEELESERLEVLEEMNGIRNQLAARKADIEASAIEGGRTNGYGSPRADPMAYAEYTRWRARATAALRHKEAEAADLKTEIKRRRVALGSGVKAQMAPLSDDPIVMLAHLLKAARDMARAIGNERMDPSHYAVIDHVSTYLTERASPLRDAS